jgi:homoserine dehydrogenase
MQTLKVGLLGCGVLGSAFIATWQENRFCHTLFSISKILVKDLSKPRYSSLEGFQVTTDPQEIVNDDGIEAVIDVMGNENDSLHVVRDCLAKGKSVITSDKYLLLKFGAELQRQAIQSNAQFRFSPAMGFDPQNLETAHQIDTIVKVMGVMDDTLSMVLPAIKKYHADTETASKKLIDQNLSQALINKALAGDNAAAELALLIMFLTQKPVSPSGITTIPFENFDEKDLAYIEQSGYALKQIAYYENKGNYFRAFVAPMLLARDAVIAGTKEHEIGLCFEHQNTGSRYLVFQYSNEYRAQLIFSDLLKIKEKQTGLLLCKAEELLSFKEEHKFQYSYYIRLKALDNQAILNKMVSLAESDHVTLKDIHLEKGDEPNHTDVFLVTYPVSEETVVRLVRTLLHSDFVKEARKIRILG